MTQFHLAQANFARMQASPDDPALADFVARLDEINLLAEQSPGFVWRYVSDARNPGDREFDDPLILFNMSVWQSAEHLHDYAYKSAHGKVFAQRGKWFEKIATPQIVLWWIEAGMQPTVKEAKQKLELIAKRGPGPRAFNFRVRYEADGTPAAGKKPQAAAA